MKEEDYSFEEEEDLLAKEDEREDEVYNDELDGGEAGWLSGYYGYSE